MNKLHLARGLTRKSSSFLASSIPKLCRGYSASSTRLSSYEHIIVSSPKPGVGLGILSFAWSAAELSRMLIVGKSTAQQAEGPQCIIKSTLHRAE